MDLTIISILIFSVIVFGVMALYLIFRDLNQPATATAGSGTGPRRFRRQVNVFDEAPADGLLAKLDQRFEWLVLESGDASSPNAVFLMLVACGLLLGGSVFVIFDAVLPGLIGMGVGMAVPLGILAWRRNRRMNAIRQELPHVVDLLARAVRAGQTLDDAIALIGEDFDGPLGQEFAKCSRQLQMGRSMVTVMQSLASRIRLMEIRVLASVLIVHRQTGGDLARALDRMSAVIRDRLNFRRQMKAATASGRFVATIIVIAAPILYLVAFLWQPDHFGILWEHQWGRIAVIASFVLMIIGIIWVARILRSEQ